MQDPALMLLEWSLSRYCDEVLLDETFAGEHGPVRRVRWRFRRDELQVELRHDPQASLAQRDYQRWRARGQRFSLLASRPMFMWESATGWRQVDTVGEWHRLLANIAQSPESGLGGAPGDGSGRPVRPRSGPPALDASAAATPEALPWEEEFLPTIALRGGRQQIGDEVR